MRKEMRKEGVPQKGDSNTYRAGRLPVNGAGQERRRELPERSRSGSPATGSLRQKWKQSQAPRCRELQEGPLDSAGRSLAALPKEEITTYYTL